MKAKTKYVYIVAGETGEYSDRIEWPACAYATLAKAELQWSYLYGLAD